MQALVHEPMDACLLNSSSNSTEIPGQPLHMMELLTMLANRGTA